MHACLEVYHLYNTNKSQQTYLSLKNIHQLLKKLHVTHVRLIELTKVKIHIHDLSNKNHSNTRH